MNLRRLPPLNSLRAFEAAARLLSFTKAADELNVTPGAISQQIKSLEAYLGLKLFNRQNRAIQLTEPAQMCLPYLSDGMDLFVEAMTVVRKYNTAKPLTITVAQAFASRWLMPRLRFFQTLHPDIDVRIDVSKNLIDLVRSDTDVGIRFGGGDYPGLQADFLMSQEVIPVCSPDLLVRGAPLHCAEDIQSYTLIHGDYYFFDGAQLDWEMWFKIMEVNHVDTSHGLSYPNAEMVVQAAIEGQGIALVGNVIVSEEIKAGLLVQPIMQGIPLSFAYYLVCSPAKADQPSVMAFRSWLLDQVNDSTVL